MNQMNEQMRQYENMHKKMVSNHLRRGNVFAPKVMSMRGGTPGMIMLVSGAIMMATSCIDNPKTAIIEPHSKPLIHATIIHLPDTAFSIRNGLAMYHSKPFSGTAMVYHDSLHIKSSCQYFNGKQEGTETSFFPNGQKESIRFYTAGEKDSIHCGWWPNGNKRFQYHFSNGRYHGNFTEWYTGGALGRQIAYSKGQELSGKGWRENGKLYMSYVMSGGRRYGLVNAQLCYSLKNERGEYVK